MVLSNLYLLCWDYDKLKSIVPLEALPKRKRTDKFPTAFFAGGVVMVAIVVLTVTKGYDVVPRNSFKDCREQFIGTNRTKAGNIFCDCIHTKGEPLDQSLEKYYKLPDDSASVK
jgi:hypothetical protein